MVKHIVMFKLKGTAEERRAVASQFKAALEALPEKIDVLRSVSIRICAPALTTSCRLCAYGQQTQGGVISFEGMPRFCIFIGCGNCVVFGKITYFCIK